jgi:hypothetical protein
MNASLNLIHQEFYHKTDSWYTLFGFSIVFNTGNYDCLEVWRQKLLIAKIIVFYPFISRLEISKQQNGGTPFL